MFEPSRDGKDQYDHANRTPAADGLPAHQRWIAVAAVSFGTALVVIDGAIVSVALPTIAHDLAVDSSDAVLVVTVYQLVLLMSLLPFSSLGDRLGHRRLYQYGLIVFTIATALCFFARNLSLLLVLRATQALGASAALSVSSALLRAIYPRRRLGRGLGFNSVIVSSSAAAAPTIGGIVLTYAPWPYVFAVAVPFGLVSLSLGSVLPNPMRRDHPFDFVGATLCAATFGLVISGMETAVHGSSPIISAAVVFVGLIIGRIFVHRELGEQRPILPVDLLGQPLIGLSAIGALTAFLASMLLMLSLPFRLEQAFGFGPREVGAAMAPWPLTTMIVAPVAGALSDRIRGGLLGGVGMAIATVALLLLALLPDHVQFVDVAWRMSLCGCGFGLFLAPNGRLIIGAAPPHRAASAGGLTSTIRLTGQTAGATLAAALLALGVGSGKAPPFLAAGLTMIAGMCGFLTLTFHRRQES